MYSGRQFFVSIGFNQGKPKRIGFEQSMVCIDGQPYLNRFICYLLGWTLRLHKFYRGDDARAPHTHPFWFITFPLKSYVELVYNEGLLVARNEVKAWRFHYRPADYEHVVLGRADGKMEPFYTIVLSSQWVAPWGFYPEPGLFVPWKEFDVYWRNK